jgi:eukaryotic-like serine/threonine-protein kinase
MVVIDGLVEFRMGSLPQEPLRFGSEVPHRRVIPRRFAIAAKEVTVEQFQRFLNENPSVLHSDKPKFSPDPDCPRTAISWYQATAFRDWLSRKEKLPECYRPNASGTYADGMRIKADALKLPGYRLPTEAEWEYACRAGAGTRRNYAETVDLLKHYASYQATCQNRTWRCGSLMPPDGRELHLRRQVHRRDREVGG